MNYDKDKFFENYSFLKEYMYLNFPYFTIKTNKVVKIFM